MKARKMEGPGRVSKAQLNREIDRHIKSSDKAPRTWGKAKATSLKRPVKKRGLRLSWGLLLIVGIIIVVVYFVFIRRPTEYEQERFIEPTW